MNPIINLAFKSLQLPPVKIVLFNKHIKFEFYTCLYFFLNTIYEVQKLNLCQYIVYKIKIHTVNGFNLEDRSYEKTSI